MRTGIGRGIARSTTTWVLVPSWCGDGHCIEITIGLLCESCGYDFEAPALGAYTTEFVPDPEFDEDYIAEHGPSAR